MALLVSRRYVSNWFSEAPSDIRDIASRYYIWVSSTHLSIPYELDTGGTLDAAIEDVMRGSTSYREITGKQVQLIIYPRRLGMDYLFISRKDWSESFREYGLVDPSFMLTLRIKAATSKATCKETQLYTKRDLEV